MRKKIAFVGIIALGLTLSLTAYAAEFIGGNQRDNGTVTVGASETHKNLYTAGGMVNVNGKTTGDLVSAGGTVTVIGEVEKDALLAGGTLIVSGKIGEDARVVGGNITLSGAIGGDLLVAGGNVTVADSSSIGADVVIAGGNVQLNAPVTGNVRVMGGNVVINGKVNGNVTVQASQGLTFGKSAEVAGAVTYKGPKEAVIEDGAKVPAVQYTKMERKDGRTGVAGIVTAAFLIKLIAWCLAAWMLMRFGRTVFTGATSGIMQKPWEHLGIGLAAFIVVPIAAALALLTVVGYYVSMVTFVAWGLVILIANVLAALVVGYLILHLVAKPADAHPDWQVIVIGVAAWSLVKFIPIVGWAASAVVFLMAFGVLFRMVKNRLLSHS